MNAPKATGVVTVWTETSTHRIDYDAMTVTRLPDTGAGQVPDLPPVSVSTLRKDHEPIALIEAPEPIEGQPMEMLLQIRDDGVPTFRRTTIVRLIQREDVTT